MNKAILGKKIGMSQIFTDSGLVIPVTVVEAGPCQVSQIKTVEKDGYSSVQLAFVDAKANRISKAEAGHLKKANIAPKKYLKEFKIPTDGLELGTEIKCDVFKEGDIVDVSGYTRGRGFSGVIQRWNFHRLPMTHGTGPIHRQPGSMGSIDPARVFKNMKMPGQYGHEQVTILNLVAVKIDSAKNLIAVKGAVPGPKGGIVFIRDSVKA